MAITTQNFHQVDVHGVFTTSSRTEYYKSVLRLQEIVSNLPGINGVWSSGTTSHSSKVIVGFEVDLTQPEGLIFLAASTNRRYWTNGYRWTLSLDVADVGSNPLRYCLQSQSLGNHADQEVRSLLENIEFNLNKLSKSSANQFKRIECLASLKAHYGS